MTLPNDNTPHQAYDQQLQGKIASTLKLFEGLELPPLQVIASPPEHYRLRAEFRVWHEGDDSWFGMYRPGSREVYRVDRFAAGSELINALMPALLVGIKDNPVLRRKLYAAEFLTTLSGEALVTLVYHKPLDDEWRQEAQRLQQTLGVNLIGRSRKIKIVLGNDYVTEELAVQGRLYRYRQYEGGFTQPNGHINRHMLEWASTQLQDAGGDLLELYCGNGNFTLPLSSRFEAVLATEISKSSVAALQWNIEANGIGNIHHARLSAEEMTEALDGVRPFRRLAHLDLDAFRFTTLLVDPPRAGLDPATEALAARFDRILYISCNPETLAGNLRALCQTHEIVAMAAFDQFPFTSHLECGVVLQRNQRTWKSNPGLPAGASSAGH